MPCPLAMTARPQRGLLDDHGQFSSHGEGMTRHDLRRPADAARPPAAELHVAACQVAQHAAVLGVVHVAAEDQQAALVLGHAAQRVHQHVHALVRRDGADEAEGDLGVQPRERRDVLEGPRVEQIALHRRPRAPADEHEALAARERNTSTCSIRLRTLRMRWRSSSPSPPSAPARAALEVAAALEPATAVLRPVDQRREVHACQLAVAVTRMITFRRALAEGEVLQAGGSRAGWGSGTAPVGQQQLAMRQ